ncbi:MAG: transglycosylase family protein [Mycobacterium sp.]
MRKQSRPAAVLLAALAATTLTVTATLGGAVAAHADDQDRTDSAAYTQSRADYWAARAAYNARKGITNADGTPADGSGSSDAIPMLVAPTTTSTSTTTTTVAVPVVADGTPTNAQLASLRMCESTDRYGVNTGNGYYGAYQFSAVTWWWLGYSGYPNEASPAVQDQAARDLYSIFGWSPWPACSRHLGFS